MTLTLPPLGRQLARLGLALLLVAAPALAPGAVPLESGFQEPPPSARPQTWWHWMNGNITRKGITADLEAMQRVGLGGAQIFNVDCGIPAGPVKFLSPEWRELMHHAAAEADRLGLELCLHNCAGWSSSGGPWNTPEHAMQRVTTSQLSLTGPQHFTGSLPQPPQRLDYYRDIAVLAFPTPVTELQQLPESKAADGKAKSGHSGSASSKPLRIQNIAAKGGFNGESVLSSPAAAAILPDHAILRSGIVDLTSRLDASGRLDWQVPAGSWTILRLGYTPTGKDNHPAPREGTGPECDKLSTAALDAHWAGFVQQVLDGLGPLAGPGKALNNVLIDSYEVGGQNWTPEFRAEFQKRRGYDPLLFLPTLTGRVVESPELSERFLWDMRRTIADLFADNYYGRFQQLCHQHGLQASIEPYTGPFDSLQCGEKADLPMGEFWVGGTPDASVKLAASIGHVFGRPIIGAESFTAAPGAQHGRWLDDPYALKALGDLVFCQGVNRLIFHRYAMQPWTNRWPGMTMGQWGTHFDRTCTWFEPGRAWVQYLARCQFLLQQGRFVADAAYFCGESAPVELRVGDPALPAGYDWDAINADALLHHASVKDGCLVLNSGMSYRLLILPPADRALRPALAGKLAQFVSDGLTVVGAPPPASPSLENYPACDAEVKQWAKQLWGDCNGRSITEHQLGRGKVVWGRPLTKVLAELNLKPDLDYPADAGARLASIHRRDGETDFYFVSNQRLQSETVNCAFRLTGKAPELWNPETGRITPAPVWREEQGQTVVRLTFDPAGSVFVVFRAKPAGEHLVAVQCTPATPVVPLLKPAQLRILKAAYGVFSSGDAHGQADVTAEVKSLVAAGKRKLHAGNDLAEEDPAPGRVKRLRVQFRLGGQTRTAETSEGGSLEVPVGAEVLKALYGDLPVAAGDKQIADVTAKVAALVKEGQSSIPVDNTLVGHDPAPNLSKALEVKYRVDGHSHSVQAGEHETLELPAGVKILQARYGNLSGQKEPSAGEPNEVDVTAKLARQIKDGQLSVRADNALAGRDPAYMTAKELRVEYSLDGVVKHATVQENETLTLPETGQAASPPPLFAFADGADGAPRLMAWAPGKFTLEWSSGRKAQAQCLAVSAPVDLAGPWEVSFPSGWQAPAKATFADLRSWTESSDPGIKYFSGTAVYAKEFEVPAGWTDSGRQVWLDLGRVKNLAEVTLNGKPLGILWKPPFRLDITGAVQPGKNGLVVKVTNLWPNRLIGDEQLPPDCQWQGKQLKTWPQWLLEGKPSPTGRLTFTTWHHWPKDAALLDSGLLGPVVLRAAEPVSFPAAQ